MDRVLAFLVTLLWAFFIQFIPDDSTIPIPPAREQLPVPKDQGPIIKDGYYRALGTEKTQTGEKPYQCLVRVEHLGENLYLVRWHLNNQIDGIGVLQGKTLQVTWSRPGKEMRTQGLSTYQIINNKTLDGEWVSLPPMGRGKEKLIYFGALELQEVRR